MKTSSAHVKETKRRVEELLLSNLNLQAIQDQSQRQFEEAIRTVRTPEERARQIEAVDEIRTLFPVDFQIVSDALDLYLREIEKEERIFRGMDRERTKRDITDKRPLVSYRYLAENGGNRMIAGIKEVMAKMGNANNVEEKTISGMSLDRAKHLTFFGRDKEAVERHFDHALNSFKDSHGVCSGEITEHVDEDGELWFHVCITVFDKIPDGIVLLAKEDVRTGEEANELLDKMMPKVNFQA